MTRKKTSRIQKTKAVVIDTTKGTIQVRATPEAALRILEIAQQLFRQYPAEHKAIGLLKPSSRVAIDYLLVLANQAGGKIKGDLTPENNLWLRIETTEIKEDA